MTEVYTVVEHNIHNDYIQVEAFKTRKEAEDYVKSAIEEYGIDESRVVSNGATWHDLDYDFFEFEIDLSII